MTCDLAGRFLLNNIYYLTKKKIQENEIIAECEGCIITYSLT
jgi:hypothetical protein